MKKEILIGSFNCQNNARNRRAGNANIEENTAYLLSRHFKKMKYDILGTQEMTKPFLEELQKYLPEYHHYGTYRFGTKWWIQKLRFLESYNENNPIFLKEEAIDSKTLHLPSFGLSFSDMKQVIKKGIPLPRIATIVLTQKKEIGTLCIINTHLQHRFPSIRQKQLNVLKKIIEDYYQKYPIILMGDFNMTTSSSIFSQFIEDLKKLGLKRVPLEASTHPAFSKAIDHLFIPSTWDILEGKTMLEVDETLQKITDHTGIYAKVSF